MKATFKEGKTYYGRSICDSDAKILVKVLKRTPKTITIKMLSNWPTDQTKFTVHTSTINGRQYEYIKLGRYSMAPIISADRLV